MPMQLKHTEIAFLKIVKGSCRKIPKRKIIKNIINGINFFIIDYSQVLSFL
jgi:hypothetical protein